MGTMTSYKSWCFLVLAVCLAQGGLSCTPVLIGGHYELNVSLAAPASLCIALDNTTQAEAIRVFVSSVNATTRHPVLVTVRQPMGVVSWALPHVESGFAYNSVERTLCPLRNRDDEADITTLLVDLSTSQHTPLYVSLETSIIKPFKLEMNKPTTLQASPSGPSYLMYEYEATPTRVRVRFTADDNSSTICAIASIQTAYCPVVELLDNPDHRGRYQTMRASAAINTKVDGTRGFLYVVLTVFPSDGRDGGCVFSEGEGLLRMGQSGDNFNSTPYTSADRMKTVTITVETGLSDSEYAVATAIAILVYASFYIVGLVWIIIFDWLRFKNHSLVKEIESNLGKFGENSYEEGRSEEREEDPVKAPPPHNTQDSSDEEEEGYSAPITAVAVETPDSGLPKSVLQQDHCHSDRLVQRPSMISVLFGSHLQTAIDKATPNGSQATFPSARSRHASESYTPAASPYGGYGGQSASLTPTPHNYPLKFPRQKSVSESHNPPTNSLMPSLGGHHVISPTSPLASHDTRAPRIRKDSNTSTDVTGSSYIVQGSLNTNSLRPLKFNGRRKTSSESSYATPTQSFPASLAMRGRSVRGQGSTSEATDNEGVDNEVVASLQRQDSYEVAVENAEMGIVEEEFSFPINVQLSDVGVIDDSSYVQKKYNHYAVYLFIAAVFYSIPAYQLVITSQRLLSSTGNEDLCYFNSLCSHPLDVNSGLTFSAFNNIFSNVGFFLLGFLYILIAYRRRRIYRSYEEYNCKLGLEERVGIPQRFGIHYAVGLALMAEGLMSTAYHICPSNTNYQFDTTFLYILAALGLHKLLESRSPDVEPGLHKIMLTLAGITLVAVVGVVYSDSLGFWIVFFLLYVVSSFIFSVEVYYRWQVKRKSLKYLFQMYRRKSVWPPQHYPKFTIMVLSVILNWGFAVYMVAVRPGDFGTIFFFCLLFNFILYLLYYAVTKCVYREVPSIRPLFFVILALIFWVLAIYFYTRRITDWSVTPAESRDGNQDCLIGFYDAHDMWHFMSAFALFFSFLMVMTLDDKQEHKPRNTLKAF